MIKAGMLLIHVLVYDDGEEGASFFEQAVRVLFVYIQIPSRLLSDLVIRKHKGPAQHQHGLVGIGRRV